MVISIHSSRFWLQVLLGTSSRVSTATPSTTYRIRFNCLPLHFILPHAQVPAALGKTISHGLREAVTEFG